LGHLGLLRDDLYLYCIIKININQSAILKITQGVPLAIEPGISLIILPLAGGPLLRVAAIRGTTDTFLFISHTTNVLLFKFRCNIFNAGFGSEWDTLYIFRLKFTVE
jgi:hypothetical protein